MICFLEGNIGAGKSAALESLQKLLGRERCTAVPEPLDSWRSVGPSRLNLLDMYYQNQKRFGPIFQWYVFATHMADFTRHASLSRQADHVVAFERSMLSMHSVFLPILLSELHASPEGCQVERSTELDALQSGLGGCVDAVFENWTDKLVVYLKTSPALCSRRVAGRARSEEECLSGQDYLARVHCLYESQLLPRVPKHSLLIIDCYDGRGPDDIARLIAARLFGLPSSSSSSSS